MAARPGRPRSEESRRRILEATRELLNERSVAAISMDAIAARARASKQTLYRWWGSKSAVVVDAVLDGYDPPMPTTVRRSGDREADFKSWIDWSLTALADPDTAAGIRAVLGAVASDSDAAHRYHDRTLAPARAAAAAIFAAAADRRPDSVETAKVDVAIAALMFWTLVDRPPDAARRRALLDMLLTERRTTAEYHDDDGHGTTAP